ncbi:hypothetical protein ES708_21576 [subsurface metagenome]
MSESAMNAAVRPPDQKTQECDEETERDSYVEKIAVFGLRTYGGESSYLKI